MAAGAQAPGEGGDLEADGLTDLRQPGEGLVGHGPHHRARQERVGASRGAGDLNHELGAASGPTAPDPPDPAHLAVTPHHGTSLAPAATARRHRVH